ncbi:zinc finger FYVE domain-containing protein 1 isoform X2 [Tamandua tetradactyla]|uniref:zinc finger FYVE domain-containing protein 1 isoform X2 n=1 Tax=Tamandua tetradactyla TaxID=48850 RepID=UPI004053E432
MVNLSRAGNDGSSVGMCTMTNLATDCFMPSLEILRNPHHPPSPISPKNFQRSKPGYLGLEQKGPFVVTVIGLEFYISTAVKFMLNLTLFVLRKTLCQALSDRFSGEIPDDQMAHSSFFPDEYFTCSSLCLSCGAGCKNSMNHGKEGVPHEAKSRCRYSHQYDNRVYTCKACYERGKEVSVVPKTSASTDSPWMGLAKYAWSGYVIECPNCGVVYRSRQYWFGNQDPVDTVVRTEIVHVWPGTDGFLKDNNNAAQRLLDGMNFMAQSVSELSLGPTKAVTSWLTDQIAPAYWRPNSQILSCNKCATSFKDNDTKHHCRACGEGFCDSCSSKTRPVPERGWGPAPVRVCDNCYEARNVQLDVAETQADEEGGTLIARKVGEAVQNTLGAVVTAIDIPLGLVKDAARPAYWVPDHEILHCHNCRKEFSIKLSKHHCRACGQGFCDECSHDRRAVPSRGWDHPVRVCFNCNKKPGDL